MATDQAQPSPDLAIPEHLHLHFGLLCSCTDGLHRTEHWFATFYRKTETRDIVAATVARRLNTWPKLYAALETADDCAHWAFARVSRDDERMAAIRAKYPEDAGSGGGDFYTYLLRREKLLRSEALAEARGEAVGAR